MHKDLEKELKTRGTAEISNGKVVQVTQALEESPTEVKILIFGSLKTFKVRSIDLACASCTSSSKKNLGGFLKCRESQKKDAVARGFSQIICPKQFIDD